MAPGGVINVVVRAESEDNQQYEWRDRLAIADQVRKLAESWAQAHGVPGSAVGFDDANGSEVDLSQTPHALGWVAGQEVLLKAFPTEDRYMEQVANDELPVPGGNEEPLAPAAGSETHTGATRSEALVNPPDAAAEALTALGPPGAAAAATTPQKKRAPTTAAPSPPAEDAAPSAAPGTTATSAAATSVVPSPAKAKSATAATTATAAASPAAVAAGKSSPAVSTAAATRSTPSAKESSGRGRARGRGAGSASGASSAKDEAAGNTKRGGRGGRGRGAGSPAASSPAAASAAAPAVDDGSTPTESEAIIFEPANPKKEGSSAYERYEKYKRARTVAEALSLGAAKGDIAHDFKRGFLKRRRGA